MVFQLQGSFHEFDWKKLPVRYLQENYSHEVSKSQIKGYLSRTDF